MQDASDSGSEAKTVVYKGENVTNSLGVPKPIAAWWENWLVLERFRAGHFTCKNTTEKNGANQSVKLNPRLRIEHCAHGFRSGLSPRFFLTAAEC